MILDDECIANRAKDLAVYGYLGKIIDAIIVGIESQNTAPRVFRNTDDFFEDVLSGFIDEEIFHHEAVNTASAETNAYFSEAFAELASDPEALRDAVSAWAVPVSGVIDMDQDPDRMFSGDKIQFSGVIRIKKAGRVCLAADMELDISAAVDHDYYERSDDGDIEEVVS